MEVLNPKVSQMRVETDYGLLKELTVLTNKERLKLFQIVSKTEQVSSNVWND